MKIIAEFKQGCREGWNMYWSPLTGFLNKAKAILALPAAG